LRWDVEGDGAQVAHGDGVHARRDEEDPGADGAAALRSTQPEDDGALVFLKAPFTRKMIFVGHEKKIFLLSEAQSINHFVNPSTPETDG
jgi:hypothetical protein